MPRSKEMKDVSRPKEEMDDDSISVDDNEGSYPQYGTTTMLSDPVNSQQAPMTKQVKLVKTSCMMLIYLGMGFWAGVVSPTSVDMADLYNTTAERFVSTTASKSIGVLSGSFVGAFTADRFRHKADIVLFLCNLFGGLSLVGVPWCPNFVLMGILFYINGLAHGTLNVVCSSINIAIWGESAPTPIHMLHMFFTLGMTISPPMIVPFLSVTRNGTASHTGHNSTTRHVSGEVRVPYAMFGIYSVVVSIIFLVFFLKKLTYVSTTVKKKESLKEMFNPGSIARGNKLFGAYFLISMFFLYFCINGRDRGMGMFLFIIAHTDVLQMSKPISAALVTAFNLSQAAGRGISALISRWFTIHTILYSQLIVGTFLQLLMVFYALESETSLWILSCFYGIVSGPTYPSVMSWADRYIEATGVVIAVIDIGIGLGGFVSVLALSKLFENHGSLAVFAVGLTFSLAVLLCLLPLQIISHLRGDRHKNLPPTHVVQSVNVEYSDFRDDEGQNDDEQAPLLTDY